MTSKGEDTKLRLFIDRGLFWEMLCPYFLLLLKTFPTRLCLRTPVEVNAICNQLVLPTSSNNPKMTSIHD